jgi:hypothetical protein
MLKSGIKVSRPYIEAKAPEIQPVYLPQSDQRRPSLSAPEPVEVLRST